jgi:predicted SnoaL-like aldol condensation-catalyzing enzyme
VTGQMSAIARAVLRRYYTDVWQDGDIAALDDLLTTDYVDHDPLPGFGTDRTAAKAMAARVTSAMPGARLDVHHIITEGDLAAAHWTMTWDPPPGHEPGSSPGTRPRLRGHDFFRLRAGRICEIWHCEAAPHAPA